MIEDLLSQQDQVVNLARQSGVLRARDLQTHGIARVYLKPLVESGMLVKTGRGLYVVADEGESDAEAENGASIGAEHQTLIEAAVRVSYGVICLASALRFHGLTTQNPWQVWLLIESSRHVPKVDYPTLQIVQASGESFTAGIETHAIPGRESMTDGRVLRVTSPAKTVVDCFKYRNKIGLDVALEALKQCLAERRTTREEIRQFARICRVEKIMQPYMEAFSI